MKKYAKVINNETKQCEVGIGTNDAYYVSIGMTLQDVEESYDGSWYLTGYAPEKPAPTRDEISATRMQYRREHIDDKTSERSRKQANNTWTEADEQAYLALDAEVTAWIEENLPYPVVQQ